MQLGVPKTPTTWANLFGVGLFFLSRWLSHGRAAVWILCDYTGNTR